MISNVNEIDQLKDVTEVNIQDEATTVFSRAKQVKNIFSQERIWLFSHQFTEEKLGRTERTEYEYEYQQLEKKTDLTKSYTEKLKNNAAAVIVPNPGNAIIKRRDYSKLNALVWFSCPRWTFALWQRAREQTWS